MLAVLSFICRSCDIYQVLLAQIGFRMFIVVIVKMWLILRAIQTNNHADLNLGLIFLGGVVGVHDKKNVSTRGFSSFGILLITKRYK